MQPKDAFAAVGTTENVASSLYKWIAGNRGLKRTVAMELQENIELIRLYAESGADPKGLVPKIKEDAFRHQECLPPSRTSSQPCDRKCDRNLRLFTQRFEPLQTYYLLHFAHQAGSYVVLPEARTGGFPIILPSWLPESSRHRFLRSIRSRNHHPFGLLRYICSC